MNAGKSVTALFPANQERLNRIHRPRGRRGFSCKHWLSGLLKCSICGASLGYNQTKDLTKRGDAFQCWKYTKGLHPGSCSVSSLKAEAAVLESLRMILETGEVEYTYEQREKHRTTRTLILIQKSLERLDTKELRIREAYESGIDTLDEFKTNKTRLQREREQLMEELRSQAGAGRRSGKGSPRYQRIRNVYAPFAVSGCR